MENQNNQHTEDEMNLIILDHLENCTDYANICELKQTEAGMERIVNRIKQLVLEDGYKDVETAIAKVDEEIAWTKLQD